MEGAFLNNGATVDKVSSYCFDLVDCLLRDEGIYLLFRSVDKIVAGFELQLFEFEIPSNVDFASYPWPYNGILGRIALILFEIIIFSLILELSDWAVSFSNAFSLKNKQCKLITNSLISTVQL